MKSNNNQTLEMRLLLFRGIAALLLISAVSWHSSSGELLYDGAGERRTVAMNATELPSPPARIHVP